MCNAFADTLQAIIVGNDSLHLTLDLNDRSNWKYFTLKKELGEGGECECRSELRMQISNSFYPAISLRL